MAIDTTKRIMWRLQEKHGKLDLLLRKDLELAIFHEAGTDKRTVDRHIGVLLRLRWIKRINQYAYKVTREGQHGAI